ncbi:MAG: VanW family protein [Candidatus Peribacteraceae bacterium]
MDWKTAPPGERPSRRAKVATVVLVLLTFVLCGTVVRKYRGTIDARTIPSQSQSGPIVGSGAFLRGRDTPTLRQKMKVNLSEAIDQRVALLKKTVRVRFAASGSVLALWEVALKDRPSWIVFEVGGSGKGRAVVSAERIRQQLISFPVEGIPQPRFCRLLSLWVDGQGVNRAQTNCIARGGYLYDVTRVAEAVKSALEGDRKEVTVPLLTLPAAIMPAEGDRVGEPLKLLAVGRSNFKGSGEGRKANVRKGLSEHLNNVYVPAGTAFSFNSVLGKSITTGNGWRMALTIFGGSELRPAPGGGICQVSTTLYRAMLQAGLPILEQKSHSLYVSYYEKYGVGQDATVFPGSQDLSFLNDTGGPLLIQSYNEGDEAFVNIYGYDDGREVTLSGPYFARNAPPDLLENGRKVRANEIVWVREVRKSDVRQRETFVARYQAIPRSLPDRWQPTVSRVRGGESIALGNTFIAKQ